MVLKCVPINEELFQLEMPLLLTATLTQTGVFIVSFCKKKKKPKIPQNEIDFCFYVSFKKSLTDTN